MYRIRRYDDGSFYVALTIPNGNAISLSKPFTQKPAAWKNIAAAIKLHKTGSPIQVIDEAIEGQVTEYKAFKGRFTKVKTPA